MNIGFDCKRAFSNNTGLVNYSRDTINLLSNHYPNEQYFLFTPKFTKNKYKEWCKKEPTKPMLSREGWVRIIKDNKATCMVKKTVFPNNIERTNSVSVSDFVQLTRHIEWYHTNSGDKKNVRDYKCKKRKK